MFAKNSYIAAMKKWLLSIMFALIIKSCTRTELAFQLRIWKVHCDKVAASVAKGYDKRKRRYTNGYYAYPKAYAGALGRQEASRVPSLTIKQ